MRAVAQALRSRERTLLILGSPALTEAGLRAAHRIAVATGAEIRTPTQIPRMPRGRGRVPIDRIPYVVDLAVKQLADIRQVVQVGSKPAMAFFAYPGKPSLVTPADAVTHVLARPEQDCEAALEWLADELGAPKNVPVPECGPKPELLRGPFEPEAFGRTLAAILPDNAIIAEDSVTSGRALFRPTFNAPPHDWIQLTGGAIGHGFPCATGAALACPDRKVVCLQADGAGMYSLQALWTQARERLDVINVVFANRVYKILHGELLAVGAKPGRASNDLFDLARPQLDWVQLAGGMGVDGARVDTLEAFADVFKAASARRGPFLIEFTLES
jgi:acetolactate synthase-1/2/3 large subunit